MMNAKQFAWMYLLKFGEYNVEPSYYGGYEVHNGGRMWRATSYKQMADSKRVAIQDIREIGVDWDKTASPASDRYTQFQGTFCEPKQAEHLTGTIYLKDGSKQFWCAEPPMNEVFDIMADLDNFKSEFEHVLK